MTRDINRVAHKISDLNVVKLSVEEPKRETKEEKGIACFLILIENREQKYREERDKRLRDEARVRLAERIKEEEYQSLKSVAEKAISDLEKALREWK